MLLGLREQRSLLHVAAAARPASVPDDHANGKVNAGPRARLWVAIGHCVLWSDNFRDSTSTEGDR